MVFTEAIANSINAINRYKSAKNQASWLLVDLLSTILNINITGWVASCSGTVTGSTNLSTTTTSAETSSWHSASPPFSGCPTIGMKIIIQGRNISQQSSRGTQRPQKLFHRVQSSQEQTEPQSPFLVVRNDCRELGQTRTRVWIKYSLIYSDGGNLALKWSTINSYNHTTGISSYWTIFIAIIDRPIRNIAVWSIKSKMHLFDNFKKVAQNWV